MKELIKKIIEWIRQHILDCIIPYDSPCVEVEPLLVDTSATPPLTSHASILQSTQATNKDDAKETEMEQLVKPESREQSTVHRLPVANPDRSIMITGGFIGKHNRKIMDLLNKFNGVDSDDEEQHRNSLR